MIANEVFLLSLSFLLAGMVYWAFKRLPDERWQFLASVPVIKDASGRWRGLNFTYYGLLTANAVAFGAGILLVLLGALGIGAPAILALTLPLLLICLPAAKWVAQIVEGKQCTFTIAGTFFVGFIFAPVTIDTMNLALPKAGLPSVPLIPALTALIIAYAFGEGLGRLACISFGCCYGVALREATPRLRRIFSRRHFVFWGPMKKIAYASGMEGQEVIPVQAMTCIVYLIAALSATLLFLRGSFSAAFIATMAITQGWRIISETWRADYRGDRKITAYQVMGVLAILLAVGLVYVARGAAPVTTNLTAGIALLWHPATVISLQLLWAMVFVMFGKSMVTGAEIAFHLRHDRI